jgi:putative transcriptional regulator
VSRAGSRIVESAREALAFAEGKADPSEYGMHVREDVDVKAIRKKVGMTQAAFARHFGVSTRTVQDWEQKHRHPSGPARAFLRVIDREPEAVGRALTSS